MQSVRISYAKECMSVDIAATNDSEIAIKNNRISVIINLSLSASIIVHGTRYIKLQISHFTLVWKKKKTTGTCTCNCNKLKVNFCELYCFSRIIIIDQTKVNRYKWYKNILVFCILADGRYFGIISVYYTAMIIIITYHYYLNRNLVTWLSVCFLHHYNYFDDPEKSINMDK